MRAKGASIMATISQMPEHMQRVREAYVNDIAQLNGPQRRRAVLALVAIEGAFLVRGLGLIDLSADEWTGVFDDIDMLIPNEGSKE